MYTDFLEEHASLIFNPEDENSIDEWAYVQSGGEYHLSVNGFGTYTLALGSAVWAEVPYKVIFIKNRKFQKYKMLSLLTYMLSI